MPRVVVGWLGGRDMQVESAPKIVRPEVGPTLRTERQKRKMRDLLMKVARDNGCNRFDMKILFGVSPDHSNKRLRLMKYSVARNQRHGL